MTIRTLLGFLLLLATMPFAAAAQPVVFPGQPLDNVAIAIENVESGQVVSRGVTGNDGFVRFYDIPGGSYRIVVRGVAKAIEKQSAKGVRPVVPLAAPPPALLPPAPPPPVLPPTVPEPALTAEQLAPPAPEASAPAVLNLPTGLSMPVRPPAVVVRMVAPGTTREARKIDTLLADGAEMLAFSVPVSGPIAIQLRHEEQ